MNEQISETIEKVHSSLGEFKSRHHNQLEKMQQDLHASSQRIEKLELIFKRPQFSDKGEKMMSHAFQEFARKGREDGMIAQKALVSSDGGTGGYLIPETTAQLIQNKLVHLNPIRSLASTTTITSHALELLLEKADAAVGWVQEEDHPDETRTPELFKVRIEAHQIYAKPRVSQRLLDDTAVDVENWIAEKIAEKMAQVENQAFLHGDGQKQPQGILTYPRCRMGEGEWNHIECMATGADGEIASADTLLDLLYSLETRYMAQASWLMPRRVAEIIRKLKDAQGGYIWQNSFSAGTPHTLLGYPVYFCDDMLADESSPLALAFGDFKSAYQIVDRQHMNILRDPYSAKPYVEFYATRRVGGTVVDARAIKLLTFTKEKASRNDAKAEAQ